MWIVMWFGSCWKSDVNYMFIRKIIRKGFKFYFVSEETKREETRMENIRGNLFIRIQPEKSREIMVFMRERLLLAL